MQRLDYWILLGSITLLRLPAMLGDSQSVALRIATFLPLWAVMGKNLLGMAMQRGNQLDRGVGRSLFAVVLVITIAYFRAAADGLQEARYLMGHLLFWLTVIGFTGVLFASTRGRGEAELARGVVLSLVVYVVTNVVFFAAGIEAAKTLQGRIADASMLASVGFHTPRVLFPLANGINGFGTVAGAALTVAALFWLHRAPEAKRGLPMLGAAVACFAAVLLTDARGALLFSGITILLVWRLPVSRIFGLRWLPVFAPLMPLVLLSILQAIPPEFFQMFSRSGNSVDIATLSNRTFLWSYGMEELTRPEWPHLFGYGHEGPAISGMTRNFAHLYSALVDTDLRGLHNFLLQAIFDYGYLGTACFLGFFFTILDRLCRLRRLRPDSDLAAAGLGGIVYLVLAGTTERVPSPHSQEVFMLLLMIGVALATRSLPRAVVSAPLPARARPAGWQGADGANAGAPGPLAPYQTAMPATPGAPTAHVSGPAFAGGGAVQVPPAGPAPGMAPKIDPRSASTTSGPIPQSGAQRPSGEKPAANGNGTRQKTATTGSSRKQKNKNRGKKKR